MKRELGISVPGCCAECCLEITDASWNHHTAVLHSQKPVVSN